MFILYIFKQYITSEIYFPQHDGIYLFYTHLSPHNALNIGGMLRLIDHAGGSKLVGTVYS